MRGGDTASPVHAQYSPASHLALLHGWPRAHGRAVRGCSMRPSAAVLRLLIRALDYEEPGLVALVQAMLEDGAACARMFGRRHTHWATPVDVDGRSAALLMAAVAGSPRICKVLVHAGADANHRGGQLGWTSPLFHAAQAGRADVVAVLLAAPGVDPSQANFAGDTPLRIAARNGHAGVVALLLANPGVDPGQADDAGATPLYTAALKGHGDVVALLLAAPGVDPNRAKDNGETPLCLAAAVGDVAVATLLLATPGVDPNQASNAGTPLCIAARRGHVGIVSVLLAAPGVDPNRARDGGATPLYIAAHEGHADVVALLVAAPGVDNVYG